MPHPPRRAACARHGRWLRKGRQGRQGAHDVGAERPQGGEHGQRIAHEVLARGADLVGEALRAVPGDDGRTLRPEIDLHAAEIGLVMKAERKQPRADAHGAIAQQREVRVVARQDGSPARHQALENLRLGFGDLLDRT